VFFSDTTFEAALQAAAAGPCLVDRIFQRLSDASTAGVSASAPDTAAVTGTDAATAGATATRTVESHMPLQRGFALVRPPGHHAGTSTSGGFCIFNNVAVTAAYALHTYPQQVKRVLVLDLDIHHGNGTQEAFYDRCDVLTVSIHKQTFALQGEEVEYPEDGRMDRVGTGPGVGYNVNIPLGADCGYVPMTCNTLDVCDGHQPLEAASWRCLHIARVQVYEIIRDA